MLHASWSMGVNAPIAPLQPSLHSVPHLLALLTHKRLPLEICSNIDEDQMIMMID